MKRQEAKDKVMMKRQESMMTQLMEVLEEIADKDCYDKISLSNKARTLEKGDFCKAYGVAIGDLPCMLTGITINSLTAANPGSAPPSNTVTLAHLLAHCADARESVSLGYGIGDLEDIRNALLLCKNIEAAFDRKLLSFVPANSPFALNQYKLYIWVDSIKKHPIFPGSPQTIGSFEGAILNLSIGASTHNPFHRALSYQAYRAFKMWGKDFGHTLPDDCDISVYQGTYKATRARYAAQLAKDIEDEVDDEDEVVDENEEEDEEDAYSEEDL